MGYLFANLKLIEYLKTYVMIIKVGLNKIVPKINMDKISDVINEIPENFEGIDIISKKRKEFYIKCLKYRFENSLYPTYLKALELENN